MRWANKVAQALKRPEVLNGVALAVSTYAQDHIDNSAGRGPSGAPQAFVPLSTKGGVYWTATKPKESSLILATRQRTINVPGAKRKKTRVITEYKVRSVSYRAGEQPLRDTGRLMASLAGTAAVKDKGTVRVTLRGEAYGAYHEHGFRTSGPNFIPLTLKGRRKEAGLQYGKDFTVAKKGVTVPARPFLVPTDDELREIAVTIKMSLAIILKGRAS
jgi:phage gpG-like protein